MTDGARERTVTPGHAPLRRGGSASGPPIWRFFLISHGVSWLCWSGAVLWAGSDIWQSPARWLVYIGGLGPTFAGVAMTYAATGRAGIVELGSRIVNPRRIPGPVLAAALLLPAVAMAGAVGFAALAGALPDAVEAGRLGVLAGDPLALASFALFVLIFGPVPEEIGWRGYALEALQERGSALGASLILGAAWALWHLPLFFITGYYADGSPPAPLLFTTAILVHSVLYTWIYNNTRRSVLAAILFHFMINFIGMLVEGDPWVEWTRTGLTALFAVVVVVAWGAGTLSGAARRG